MKKMLAENSSFRFHLGTAGGKWARRGGIQSDVGRYLVEAIEL